MLTLEPFGGLASVTAASVLQLAVVMRAYEMVRCLWCIAARQYFSKHDGLLALLLHLLASATDPTLHSQTHDIICARAA